MPQEKFSAEFVLRAPELEELLSMFKDMEKQASGVGEAFDESMKSASARADRMAEALAEAEEARRDINNQAPIADELDERLEQARADMRALGDEVDTASSEARQMEKRIDRLAANAREAASQTDRFSASSADARQSAMALGNIMSDLPHGPAAAANNVGELIEGFSHAKRSLGSITSVLSAMAGPALLGGAITAVIELATRWDKFSRKVKSTWQWMKGINKESREFAKQVDKLQTKGPERIAGNVSDEQAERMMAALRPRIRRTRRLQEITSSVRGDAGMAVARAKQFPDVLRGDVSEEDIRFLRGLDPKEAERIASRDIEEEVNLLTQLKNETIAPGKAARQFAESVFPNKPELRRLARQNFTDSGGGGGDSGFFEQSKFDVSDPGRVAPPNAPTPVPGTRILPDPSRRAERRQAARTAELQARRARALRSARSIRDPFERQKAVVRTKARFDRKAKAQKAQRLRAKLGPNFREDGVTPRERELNMKLQRTLQQRKNIRAQKNREIRRIEKQHAQAMERQRMQKLRSFRQFAGNFQQIGSALSQLHSTWRKQRVRELKKEGKSQKEINRTIREEGRKRFQFMKKVRIASAIASTLSSGVLAFEGTLKRLGGGPVAYGVAISQMLAALATGYARVKKLRNLTIGGGTPGQGGGASGARFTQLSGRLRNERVENFAEERARDNATRAAESAADAVKEEQQKTREAIREGMSIGDDETFETIDHGSKRADKTTS